jgi:excisionase family DNA binding protein
MHNENELPAPRKGALTIAETARELGITTKTLYLAIKTGDIRAFRIGRVWRVPIEEVTRVKSGAEIRTLGA